MNQIRAGTREDIPFIVQAQIDMAFETEALRLDRETVIRGVGKVFDDPRLGQYFLAFGQNESPLACLLTVPEWSDWRNGTVLWIHSVYVIPPKRRQGVFRSLYAFLKSHVENSADLRGLRLYVERTNHPAQKTYVDLGMNKNHYDLFEWLKT